MMRALALVLLLAAATLQQAYVLAGAGGVVLELVLLTLAVALWGCWRIATTFMSRRTTVDGFDR